MEGNFHPFGGLHGTARKRLIHPSVGGEKPYHDSMCPQCLTTPDRFFYLRHLVGIVAEIARARTNQNMCPQTKFMDTIIDIVVAGRKASTEQVATEFNTLCTTLFCCNCRSP